MRRCGFAAWLVLASVVACKARSSRVEVDTQWTRDSVSYAATLNKDNEAWRLPAYTPVGDRNKNLNQRRRQWRNNSSTCNW
jgi:hypothetical protein